MTRELPQDIDAERSLLATICAPGAEREFSDCMVMMCADDFMHPNHRAIFEALVALDSSKTEVTPVSIADALGPNSGRVGGFLGVCQILEAMEVGKPRHLVEILVKHRKRRELIRIGSRLAAEAYEDDDPAELVASACSDLAGMTHAKGEGEPVPVWQVTDEIISDLMSPEDRGFGTRTGFYRFDGITHGFKPGELIILAARPGVGKTTLALNWALRASEHGSVPVFSLEMSRQEVTRKLLTDRAGINLRDFNPRDPDHIRAIGEAKYHLDNLPLLVDDRSGINVRQIRSKVERLQTRQPVNLVVIDYLQLLSSTSNASKNETNRIGEISRELKLMAKDCRVPVVVLSQLNREIEKRQNGKPQLSDLRDSGCIEQDADMVVFIHRKITPGLSQELQEKTAELHVAKHRNGPCGMVPLAWDGALSRYTEIDRNTEWEGPSFTPGHQVEMPWEDAV